MSDIEWLLCTELIDCCAFIEVHNQHGSCLWKVKIFRIKFVILVDNREHKEPFVLSDKRGTRRSHREFCVGRQQFSIRSFLSKCSSQPSIPIHFPNLNAKMYQVLSMLVAGTDGFNNVPSCMQVCITNSVSVPPIPSVV